MLEMKINLKKIIVNKNRQCWINLQKFYKKMLFQYWKYTYKNFYWNSDYYQDINIIILIIFLYTLI